MISAPPITDTSSGQSIGTVWATWFLAIWRALRGWRESYTASVVVNFGSIAANTQATDTSLTVADAKTTDVFLCSASVNTSGILFDAYCATDGVITIRAANFTAGAVDPASATFRVIGFRQ